MIQFILVVKAILKKMVLKIIQYFNQCTDILKRLLVLAIVNIFIFWKSKSLSDEKINSVTASNYNITRESSYHGSKTKLKFN